MNLVSIGADPEAFLSYNGNIFPCVGILGGDKGDPFYINEHLGVLEDNVCIEWNLSPSFSKEEFVEKSLGAITIIKDEVIPEGTDLEIKSYHEFTDEQLSTPQACEFGCQPDYNAWTMKLNKPFGKKTNYRAAGGHIHLGISDEMTDDQVLNLARLCDALIGTYSVMNEENTDRRSMYGMAGSFRVKEYGIEYRTPSNFWVSSLEHTSNVFDLASIAVSLIDKVTVEKSEFDIIPDSINNHNVDSCSKIHGRYIKMFEELKITINEEISYSCA